MEWTFTSIEDKETPQEAYDIRFEVLVKSFARFHLLEEQQKEDSEEGGEQACGE